MIAKLAVVSLVYYEYLIFAGRVHDRLNFLANKWIGGTVIVVAIVSLALISLEKRSPKMANISKTITFLLVIGTATFTFESRIISLIVAVGIIFNVLALTSNGWYMPVDPAAYRQRFKEDLYPRSFGIIDKRHVVASDKTKMRFFIDRFGNRWLGFGVCSVGDLLMYVGLILNTLYYFTKQS